MSETSSRAIGKIVSKSSSNQKKKEDNAKKQFPSSVKDWKI